MLEYQNSGCRDCVVEIDWDREAIFREYASREDIIDYFYNVEWV